MDEDFLDSLTPCSNSGVGNVYGSRYNKQCKAIQNASLLDSTINIDMSNGSNTIRLFGMFCGFNGGTETAKYCANQIVREIFQVDPINMSMSPNQIIEKMKEKFEIVAKNYFESMMEFLDRRLLAKLSGVADDDDEISEIDERIRKGATSLIILQINQDLYVLNCGRSMALAIKNNKGDSIQLNNILHENDNPIEMERLQSINVNPSLVLNPTRAIGDLQRSHLYEELEEFKNLRSPPVVSIPDVEHVVIEESWKYIVIISDGVVQNLKDISIDDIPTEISLRLKEEHTPISTAQGLVDEFARKHNDDYIRKQEEHSSMINSKREEMTVIFVKLPQQDYYENADSTGTTYDSVNNYLVMDPITPYVDIPLDYESENLNKLKKFLLDD